MLKISSTFYSRPFEEFVFLLQFIVKSDRKLKKEKALQIVLRVEHSNCIRRLFFSGSGLPELKKCAAYFFKGEKAAALQLRSPAGGRGDYSN
jgi:hypothetical protein